MVEMNVPGCERPVWSATTTVLRTGVHVNGRVGEDDCQDVKHAELLERHCEGATEWCILSIGISWTALWTAETKGVQHKHTPWVTV